MLSLLTGGFGGIFTGLLGTLLSSVMGYFSDKQKNAHELAMLNANTEAEKALTAARIAGQVRIAETQTEGEMAVAERKSFDTSQVMGNTEALKTGYVEAMMEGNLFSRTCGTLLIVLLGFVDLLQKLIRPGITVYLLVLSTWITVEALAILSLHGKVMDAVKAMSIVEQSFALIFSLLSTVVTWWFGDRAISKRLAGKNG